MGDLLGIDFSTNHEHDSNNNDCGTENAQVINCGCLCIKDTEREVGPPMESLEDVENGEHADNLEIVLDGVLVDKWIIAVIHVEVCTLFLGLCVL